MDSLTGYKKGHYLTAEGKDLYLYAGTGGWVVDCGVVDGHTEAIMDDIHANYERAEEYATKLWGKLTPIDIRTTRKPTDVLVDYKYGFRIRNHRINAVMVNGIWVEDCNIKITGDQNFINFNSETKNFTIK